MQITARMRTGLEVTICVSHVGAEYDCIEESRMFRKEGRYSIAFQLGTHARQERIHKGETGSTACAVEHKNSFR